MSTPLPRNSFILRKGLVLFDIALALAVAAASFFRLRAYPDPPGQNGYFYLKQTKTLAESMTFYFGDHSLAFLPPVLLRRLTGDELLAFQLGIALALALVAWGVCHLVDRAPAARGERMLFKICAVTALFSSHYFGEFSLNYYKNLVAGACLLWCAGLLLRGSRRAGFALFCVAFFTHKSVALIGAAYLFAYLAERAWQAAVEKAGRAAALRQLAAASLAAGIFLGLFLAFFPNAAAFLEFVSGNFAAPGQRLRWWSGVFRLHPGRALELAALAWILAALLFRWRDLSGEARRLLVAVGAVFVLAVQPFQQSGDATLGYRLVLLLPLLLIPLAALAGCGSTWTWRAAVLAPLLLAAAPGFSPLGLPTAAVERQIRPFSRLRADVEKIPSLLTPSDYLISHHGMEFFVDYVTGIRSRSFLPEPEFHGRRFRLAFVPEKWTRHGPARDEIEQVQLLHVGESYVLLEEDDWVALANEHDFPSTWRNPERRKPAHVYAD